MKSSIPVLVSLITYLSQVIILTLAASMNQASLNENLDNSSPRFRARRAILADENSRWTKGIIPYVFHSSNNEQTLKETRRTMATLERFTCLRFEPWTNTTKDDFDLGHDGYLTFGFTSRRCYSNVGNLKKPGQWIQCCSMESCMHELGHAIGFIHEHQSPEKEGWIRLNEEFVGGKMASYKAYDDGYVKNDQFDVQSVMVYSADTGGSDYNPLLSMLDLDLTSDGFNFYYLFKEIASAYRCSDLNCPNFNLTCVNDGFATVVDGQCACMCPEGLDPLTGCRSIMKAVPPGTSFPGGKWGLPMPKVGCPDDGFLEGYRKHFTDTSDGKNSHSTPYNLKGTIDDAFAEHYFCVNNETVGDPNTYWGQGTYCVYAKGGECPQSSPSDIPGTDLRPGSINFLFKNWGSWKPAISSGTLTDGLWDESKTSFNYCCKDTGFPKLPMILPNRKPFALFLPRNNIFCQKIFGMHARRESVAINSLNYAEASPINSTFTPYDGTTTHSNIMSIKHCYYTPAVIECGEMLSLSRDNPSLTITPKTGDHRHCTWHISGPEGSRIKIDLKNMNVKGSMKMDIRTRGDQCEDIVDVRHVRLGQVGKRYCGNGSHSIMSYFNETMIQFVTYSESTSSFSFTVTLVPDDELCFNLADKGASYVGKVNFTKNFTPCLPWSSVTKCRHHAFNVNDMGKNLDHNYCRMPGNGFRPWCYTKLTYDYCVRDYCDVCQKGTRFDDEEIDCQAFKEAGNCSSDKLAIKKCPKSCQDKLPSLEITQASLVICPFPPPLPDGNLTAPVQDIYHVGDSVSYKCKDSAVQVDRVCLSNGQWSAASHACQTCGKGYRLFNNKCYKFITGRKSKVSVAKTFCKSQGGLLASCKDKETSDFLVKLSGGEDTWLGGESQPFRTDYFWQDGTPLEWTNWKEGQPLKSASHWCTLQKPNGQWESFYCEYFSRDFICETEIHENAICADFLATCSDLIAARPDMCTAFPEFAQASCQMSCNFCNVSSGCQVVKPTENAEFVHKSYQLRQQVPEGTELHYTCKDGMDREYGDVIRFCQGGSLTGLPLVCKGPEDKCGVPVDLAFLVDTSRGISSEEFQKEMQFVIALADEFEIGSTKTQVSVVTYAHTYHRLFCFNSHSTYASLVQGINDKVDDFIGSTKTYKSLKYLYTKVFTESCGQRSNAVKIAILITNGGHYNMAQTVTEANNLKNAGVTLVTVGVSNGATNPEFGDLSSPGFDFYSTYNELNNIKVQIAQATCEEAADSQDLYSVLKRYLKQVMSSYT